MSINSDKPHLWKKDIARSVDTYNNWFINFAPKTYRKERSSATKKVESAFKLTKYLTNIGPAVLKECPYILPILRMATSPPLARDRLIGLSRVSPTLVKSMEIDERLPLRLKNVESELENISQIITKLFDLDISPWLENDAKPTKVETNRSSTIIADRLCGTSSDPIIRNEQEKRQLRVISNWLFKRGYKKAKHGVKFDQMKSKTFAIRLNISVKLDDKKQVNIPIDVAIMLPSTKFPLLIEAKSAGDFTNTNKRRKEEAMKFAQLKKNYGDNVKLILFLNGYFDSGYLGYEAAEGLDWVWEHRLDDLAKAGV